MEQRKYSKELKQHLANDLRPRLQHVMEVSRKKHDHQHRLTYSRMALDLGVSRTSLSKFIKGETTPSFERLLRIDGRIEYYEYYVGMPSKAYDINV